MRTILLVILVAACSSKSSSPPSSPPPATPPPATPPTQSPPPVTPPADPNCGMKTDDWCPAPAGDPCGDHKDTKSCKADPKCSGMPYKGESFVACQYDARGFATNCPTVGCQTK